MADLMYRLLAFGSGMIAYGLLSAFVPHWVKRGAQLLENVLPGRKFRRLSRRIEFLTEQSKRINGDIDDIKRLLVKVLESDNKKVATPLKNGIATPQ